MDTLAMNTLTSMFPRLDRDGLASLLAASDGDLETTIESLLDEQSDNSVARAATSTNASPRDDEPVDITDRGVLREERMLRDDMEAQSSLLSGVECDKLKRQIPDTDPAALDRVHRARDELVAALGRYGAVPVYRS